MTHGDAVRPFSVLNQLDQIARLFERTTDHLLTVQPPLQNHLAVHPHP